MPKFEFVKNKDGAISVDKLSFDHSNDAQKQAIDWLKNDLDIQVVIIKQVDPKDKYKLMIDRIGIIKTHFELKESDYDSITSKIGNNQGNEDEKKASFLDKRGIKPSSNGTDHKK